MKVLKNIAKGLLIFLIIFLVYFFIRFGQLDFWYKTVDEKLMDYPNVEWKTEDNFLSFTTYVDYDIYNKKDLYGKINVNGDEIPIELGFNVTNRKTHKNLTYCYRITQNDCIKFPDDYIFKANMNMKKEKLVINVTEYYNGIKGPNEIILYKQS